VSASAAVWLALGTGAVSGFVGYWHGVGRTERVWRNRLRATRETFLFLMRRSSATLTPSEQADFDAIVTRIRESS
jgi:hypothetical protein